MIEFGCIVFGMMMMLNGNKKTGSELHVVLYTMWIELIFLVVLI